MEIGEDEQQWRRGRGRTAVEKTNMMDNSEEVQKTKRMSSAEDEEFACSSVQHLTPLYSLGLVEVAKLIFFTSLEMVQPIRVP